MTSKNFPPAIHEFSLAEPGRELGNLFLRLSALSFPVFLDGCRDIIHHGPLNRFSFLSADPVDQLIVEPGQPFDFSELRRKMASYQGHRVEGLPPFQGGLAGFLAYDLNAQLESITTTAIDDFAVPWAALFVYDVVIAIDHDAQRGWIISQGWPEVDWRKRRHRAEMRLEQFMQWIGTDEGNHASLVWIPPSAENVLPRGAIYRLDHAVELYSDFARGEFLDAVDRAVEYIYAGDIFQVNLSQRLLTPATRNSTQLYLDLRTMNPAPFSSYLDFGQGQIISALPERLASLQDGRIETRPIKGTRRRTRNPEVDLDLKQDLVTSRKDRAENVMIVDLMRNDLSRVSHPQSVVVRKLCGVEQFQNVQHLVSVVEGFLQDPHDGIDLLRAVFPGGSITGAPKIRAMEIIAELEPTVRGAYCGSLGYLGFDGSLDFNILIRTITASDGWWQVPAGGGIVSDSVSDLEYEETWTKAVGMLNAVTQSTALQRANRMVGNSP